MFAIYGILFLGVEAAKVGVEVVHVKIRMIVSVDMRMNEPEHVRIVDTGHAGHWSHGGAQLWLDIMLLGLWVSLSVAVCHAWWSEDGGRGDISRSEDCRRGQCCDRSRIVLSTLIRILDASFAIIRHLCRREF